jgi:CRISPR-associated protein Cas1
MPIALADDMMEPYRPFADRLVLALINEFGTQTELTPEVKKKLLVLPAQDVVLQGETSPMMIAMQRTSASLAKCFLGEARKLFGRIPNRKPGTLSEFHGIG